MNRAEFEVMRWVIRRTEGEDKGRYYRYGTTGPLWTQYVGYAARYPTREVAWEVMVKLGVPCELVRL